MTGCETLTELLVASIQPCTMAVWEAEDAAVIASGLVVMLDEVPNTQYHLTEY